MLKSALPAAALLAAALLAASPFHAQDIVGLEDCSQAKGQDKKNGCLQSNVAFLHSLNTKNDAAAQAKFKEDAARLSDAAARLDALQHEVERLRLALEQLEKKVPAKAPAK
jgi:hypothetical protein